MGGGGGVVTPNNYLYWDSAKKGYISKASGILKGRKFTISSKGRKNYNLSSLNCIAVSRRLALWQCHF